MVRLKQAAIIGLAALCAYVLTELVVRYVIHYPPYGVERRVFGTRSPGLSSNLFLPYSEYWNVEGGNRVFRRNNLGLPGIDVTSSPSMKYMFVLGSSYIQSYEVPPESISTSLLQSHLQRESRDWGVLNLGRGDLDPYDSYFRAVYFENLFRPSVVMLVIEEGAVKLLSRRKAALTFPPDNQVVVDTSPLIVLHNFLRNHSAFANLVAKHAYDNQPFFNQNVEAGNLKNDLFDPLTLDIDTLTMGRLFACVDAFSRRFGERFVLLSIAEHRSINQSLNDYCSRRNIAYASHRVATDENRINRKGHLNVRGQRILAECLHASLSAVGSR